jgi:DNA-binding CsgD family transcriptional regulator
VRLAYSDYDLLLQTILELHERAATGSLTTDAPTILSKLLPCDSFAIFSARLQAVPFTFQLSGSWKADPLVNEEQVRRLSQHFPSHPFTRAVQEQEKPTAVRLSDFYSMRELRNQPFYRDLYEPAGIDKCLAIGWPTGRGMVFLNANRGPDSRDFSDRDRQLMELVRPHFEQARRASERTSTPSPLATEQLRDRRLTPREIEVARWLSRGKTNAEIAVILLMQPRTVEKHVERILVKLGVENRTSAALLIRGADAVEY